MSPAVSVQIRKTELRRSLRARLSAIPATARLAASRQALEILRGRPEWRGARVVLLFAPLPDELDVWPLAAEAVRAGRTVALPRFHAEQHRYEAVAVSDLDRDLTVGRYGIREPVAGLPPMALNQLDFVLVPGLGFDYAGRRLGRGRGWYDRLLAEVRGVRCGVAMDCQVVPEVPSEPHDRVVDCILTPTRWLAVAPGTAET